MVDALHRVDGDVRVVIGTSAADAERRAQAVAEQGSRGVVSVGGDGAAHIGINVAMRAGVPLGVVAAGSGNDFARAVGTHGVGPEAAVAEMCRSVAESGVAVDVGRLASGRYFGCVLSMGFDAAVNAKANTMSRLGGRSRYPLAMLSELRAFRPLDFTLNVDGTRYEHRGMLVAVGNTRSYGGGMLICPTASVTDGQFQVTVIDEMSVAELLLLFPRVYRGTHVDHPKATVYRGRNVEISPQQDTGGPVFADGEQVGMGSVSAALVPAALRVLTRSLP